MMTFRDKFFLPLAPCIANEMDADSVHRELARCFRIAILAETERRILSANYHGRDLIAYEPSIEAFCDQYDPPALGILWTMDFAEVEPGTPDREAGRPATRYRCAHSPQWEANPCAPTFDEGEE